eukprot:TRINITY_DN1703_c0_g1_i1.p1 TRINITY_DN1703_c0_g1~~TRINITY_DN1703_c0_g1_i1.p1  ORF type:complete len:113 (-),score=25.63 TRINITY_DN1703_c0_g1_i1:134-472(-)
MGEHQQTAPRLPMLCIDDVKPSEDCTPQPSEADGNNDNNKKKARKSLTMLTLSFGGASASGARAAPYRGGGGSILSPVRRAKISNVPVPEEEVVTLFNDQLEDFWNENTNLL